MDRRGFTFPANAFRTAALVIGSLDAASWVLLAGLTFLSQSDSATKGLDIAHGWAATALFALLGCRAWFWRH